MNLIELVEQARAVVRVWDGDRLVAVVPVRYPEMRRDFLVCPHVGTITYNNIGRPTRGEDSQH